MRGKPLGLTRQFAIESIFRWWEHVGKHTFQQATKLYITCDSGGSNSYTARMWKLGLQQLANHAGLVIQVSHFPRGTSKWNKIEHKLFCYISKHWQGQPLVDVQTAIDLIGSTTTTTGLRVICVRDNNEYETGKVVSDEDFDAINLENIAPFECWNYKISPQ